MKEDKFHKWIQTEIESEAEALEKRAEEDSVRNAELSGIRMPDNSREDLMRRIGEREAEKAGPKPFRFRRRALAALVLAAVLLAAAGIGTSGERLFAPKVDGQIEDGEYNVTIISGDDEIYKDISEEEAYDEIEERLGILALRLGYKPKGMELGKVYVDENMGEAQMEFYYGDSILTIYENKQNRDAIFDAGVDGEVVETSIMFQNNKELKILKINRDGGKFSFAAELKESNAYYQIISTLELNEFEEIVQGMFFATI